MKAILLQDAPSLLCELEGSLLRRSDLRLTLAASGPELLQRAERERPDLVVLLETIPQGPSGALLERLRRLAPPPATLLLCCCEGAAAAAHHDLPCDAVLPAAPDPRRLLAWVGERLGLPHRDGKRRPCRLRASVSRGDETRVGTTRDLSEGGAFVALRRPWEESTRVHLRLRTGAEQGPVDAAGSVVRAVWPEADPERLAGMAIRFDKTHRIPVELLDTLGGGAPGLRP